jgi:hypothetical protein
MNTPRVQLGRARALARNDGLIRFGRFGYAAKGFVYVVVGLMAIRAAFEAGEPTPESRSALFEIADKPFGEVLLWLIAVGLLGHSAWRLVQALRDTENKGRDLKGMAIRAGYAISGVVHLSLAAAAARIARGKPSSGRSEEGWTAELMSQPFGRWLVAIVGLGIVGLGISQLLKAYTSKFAQQLRLAQMSPTEQKWAMRSGRAGFAARGVTFAVIGGFLVMAARHADPQEAKGLAEALQTLEQQPLGQWLLAIVGLGLLAYGIFQFVQAKYRRMVA